MYRTILFLLISSVCFGETPRTINAPYHSLRTCGGVAVFDGTNDYITVANDAYFNFGTGDFSISFWIKTTSTSIADLFGGRENDAKSWRVVLDDSGNIVFDARIGNSFQSEDKAVNDGLWHHVCITVDRDSFAFIYIDGINYCDESDFIEGVDVTTGTGDFVIAVFNKYPTLFFSGSLDDLRIYKSALTSSDISKIYAGQEITASPSWSMNFNTMVNASTVYGTTNGTLDGAVIDQNDTALDLTTSSDFANKPSSAVQIIGKEWEEGQHTANYVTISFMAGFAADKSFNYKIYAWRNRNGSAELVCSGTATTGTNAVAKYPDTQTATNMYWVDTITCTDYWIGSNSINIVDSGNNHIAKLALNLRGYRWLYVEFTGLTNVYNPKAYYSFF